jgi:hypothetical protein
MQLRPRDGTGRAVTANDGKLRSFGKIMDVDESDDLTYEGVRGGKIYKMLAATGTNYVKFAEYKHDNDVNKKVPKLKNIYRVVKELVGNAITDLGKTTQKVDFKAITEVRKYYVGAGLITDTEFNKIMKEYNLLVTAQPDENTTDYNDIKAFVDEAISTYRKMHPNRRISLKDPKYKGYIAKVLLRLKQNYVRDSAAIDIITYSGTDADDDLIYSGSIKTDFQTNNRAAHGASEDYATIKTKTTLIAKEKELPVISKTKVDSADKLETLTAAQIADQPDWFRAISVQAKGEDAKALKELIEETYNQFVKRSTKLIKKDPTIEYDFKDGAKPRSRRAGHSKKHHDGRSKKGGRKSRR